MSDKQTVRYPQLYPVYNIDSYTPNPIPSYIEPINCKPCEDFHNRQHTHEYAKYVRYEHCHEPCNESDHYCCTIV